MLTEAVTVRGQTIGPGDLAFLYRQDTADFLFGNIHDVTDTTVSVSFAKAGSERREPTVEVPLEQVLFASELGARDPSESKTYFANDVLLKVTNVDSAEAVGVIASQEEPGHPLLVAKVVFDPQRGWTVTGTPFIAQPNDVYHPRLLSAIQRWRFLAPVHPLFDVLREKVGEHLRLQQPGTLKIGGVDIPVNVLFAIDGHVAEIQLTAHYSVASLMGSLEPKYFVDEELVPNTNSTPQWHAYVAVSGTSHHFDEAQFTGTVSVIPRSIEITHVQDQPIVVTRETYIGAKIEAWSHLVWRREPPVNFFFLKTNQNPPNSIQFDCFGSNAIVYEPPSYEGTQHEYLSVVRLGEPLSEGDHAVLSAFIGYITGGRASNVLTETFALDAKLKTVIHDRGEPTNRKQPPIPILRSWGYTRLITRHFTEMLNNFKKWRTTDARSFDAVFHHYAEGVDSNYPVTRVLRLAIAFDAFVNLVTQDTAENESIVPTELYKPLRGRLEETIKEYGNTHRDDIPSDAETRYVRKLEGFNTASNTQRARRFWELVPIELTTDDEKLLRRLRNDSVHKGFLGEGDEEQDVLGDADDANRLCDILNRAILHYAGYTGPVLSARNGRWIDARTGKTYHVPPIPHGGTIEIKHNVSPPPLTDEEKAAVEALNGMQRDDKPAEQFIVNPELQFPSD